MLRALGEDGDHSPSSGAARPPPLPRGPPAPGTGMRRVLASPSHCRDCGSPPPSTASESLFLLPALIVVGGVLLAELGHAVDRAIGAERAVPGTLAMSSNTATWLLSTVAGAMITTAGV